MPRWRIAGFTMLELCVGIAILGFLAAMIVPFIGHLDKAARIKNTYERLEAIGAAIVGPPNVYDAQGMRVVEGYVRDFDELPKLYKSTWDNDKECWVWSSVYDDVADNVYGLFQPRGLWERQTDTEDLGPGWKGPYISYPKDEYPKNANHLDWNNPDDREEFERRQTQGKLADAWGRTLLFWKAKESVTNACYTLWIISEGPDRKSILPTTIDPSYTNVPYDSVVGDAYPENKDNIVLKIPPSEWYTANKERQEEKTKRVLEGIRAALIGPPDAFDPSGRRIVGGYIGDMGQWPKLWEWDSGNNEWKVSSSVYGQPRGLWVWHSSEGTSDPDTYFCWRGPYLAKPWGEGEEEVLRDAWGSVIEVYKDSTAMTVYSPGRDKLYNTGDDISITVNASDWQITGGMTFGGKVINESVSSGVYVDVKLHHQPSVSVTVADDVYIGPGGEAPFTNSITDKVYAGLRLVEADPQPSTWDSVYQSVFIGLGGTQSPVEEKLILRVK